MLPWYSFFPLSSCFPCLFFSDVYSIMPTLVVVPASPSFFFFLVLPFVSWPSAFSSTQGIFMMLFVRLRLRSPSSLSHICNFLLAMGNIADNPWWLSGKESTCPYRRHGFDPWVMKIPWRRQWQPTPVFLPGEFHDRGPWQATVHGVAKSWMRLNSNNNG